MYQRPEPLEILRSMRPHMTRARRIMGGKERGWHEPCCSCGWVHWTPVKDHARAEALCRSHLAELGFNEST